MNYEKCKNCPYCSEFHEENENGEYLTLYCWRQVKECPFEKKD